MFKHRAMNDDALAEILSHLSVQSLLRFRAVCRSWRDVIDSPSFRKLHDRNSKDRVFLQFNISDDNAFELSVKLLDNGKSLKLYSDQLFNHFSCKDKLILSIVAKLDYNDLVRYVDPIKGLVCINITVMPIAICNPFLGQLKILPISSKRSSCKTHRREVGVGFDDDYKVVELVYCFNHRRLHAHLYSRTTSSWRELGGDGGVLDREIPFASIGKAVRSLCKNGRFAHWLLRRGMGEDCEDILLSFDMKSEAFRTITMVAFTSIVDRGRVEVLAKDESSFSLLVLGLREGGRLVRVYESRCEGSELSWKHVKNVELQQPSCGIPKPIWRSDCLVLMSFSAGEAGDRDAKEVSFYDYRAGEFIGCFKLPARSEIVEYKESLFSP